MSARFRGVVLVAAVAMTGCSGVLDPEDADPRLRTSIEPDASWSTMERDAFTYRVPPGFEQIAAQPIDSDAVTFVRDEANLHHDYGWYTGPWTDKTEIGGAPVREVVRQEVRIGGRAAEVVSFRYGNVWVVRAWWPSVGRWGGEPGDLLLRGETVGAADRDELLAALYSVRFR